MPGSKKVTGQGEPVGLRVPEAVYRKMMAILVSEDRWPYPARQNFILEAIKEKIDRWKKDHPMWSLAAKERPRERV